MKRLRFGRLLIPFVIAAALLAVSPLVFLAVGSLTGNAELKEALGPVFYDVPGMAQWKLLPLYPTLRAYIELLLDSPKFFVMFWNSVRLTAAVIGGQLLVGIPAAWGFAKYEFPFKRTLFALYTILMLLPFQVTMLSEYLVLDKLSLLNTHVGIILPAVFSTFPVFIMVRFFESVPDAVIESARLDGAGHIRLFLQIGVPLGMGGITSAMVLTFLDCWNMIEQPLVFLKEQSLWPLSVFLPNIEPEKTGVAFAASVVALIPAMLVFFGGQQYLEQGIMASAVKE